MYEKPIDRPQRDPFDALVDVLTAASRYDVVLWSIPLAFTVALVAALVFEVSVIQTFAVAAMVGILAVVDACYVNPPIGGNQEST